MCDGERLYKPIKPKQGLKAGTRKKQGIALEQDVVDLYNNMALGRRKRNSGALWYDPGDVDLVQMLGEAKERGTVNSRGQKTFQVTKEMLEKIAFEADTYEDKLPILFFRFKGDDQVYSILRFEDIVSLVLRMRN